MEALLTGIWGRYDAGNTFKTACTNGLHLETAPQDTEIPYATYTLVMAVPDYYFAGVHEVARIQFDIYAQSNAVRQDLYTKLTALYDNCTPTVTGYTTLIMTRIGQQSIREGDQNDVYRYIVEYAVTLEKAI